MEIKTDSKYNCYKPDEMILRDILAADRTVQANERTLLAYIRTGVSLLAAGIGLVKYIDDIKYLGWFFIVLSIVITVVGIKRTVTMGLELKKAFHRYED